MALYFAVACQVKHLGDVQSARLLKGYLAHAPGSVDYQGTVRTHLIVEPGVMDAQHANAKALRAVFGPSVGLQCEYRILEEHGLGAKDQAEGGYVALRLQRAGSQAK